MTEFERRIVDMLAFIGKALAIIALAAIILVVLR